MLRPILTLLVFVLSACTALAQQISAPSVWTNQRTSVLTISSIDADGRISGLYVNRAAGTECLDTPYPVTGRLTGNRIVFTTTFDDCDTVTVWKGSVKGQRIVTKFEAAYSGRSGHIKIWRGVDKFRPQGP